MCKRQAGHRRGDAIARLGRQLVAALKDHLTTGEAPQVPEAGVPLWLAFVRLSAGRRWSEVGPDPLQPGQIEAFARLSGLHLPPHHIALIMALEAAWLEWARTPEKDRVAGVLTADMFDAMVAG